MLKWLAFALIGFPIQILVYILYPLVYLGWSLFVFRPSPNKAEPTYHNFDPASGQQTLANGALLLNQDDHGAFSQYGFIQKEGLELLQKDGNLIRKLNPDGTMNREAVSGDVVVAWFFANAVADRPASDEVIKNVADSYMKNMGTLSYDALAQGYVSVRCANFGVNGAIDSDFLKISQPATGPQFYTTSAVLAGAYNKGFKYKALFWSHWILMGGWYWAFAPVIYPNQTDLWYTRDITMKALYVHLQTFGPRWWIKKPMEYINDKISTHRNDLFDAMMNRPIGKLASVINPFFSQRSDASSVSEDMDHRESAYIDDAIKKIKSETKYK